MDKRTLIYEVSKSMPNFFSKTNMEFFGDTYQNFALSKGTITIKGVECYKLIRKKPVRAGLAQPFYFSITNYKRVFSE